MAAISARTAAVSNGKPWSVHAVDEQEKRLDAEAAENEACQLQQGNKGFLIVCSLQVHVLPQGRWDHAAALKACQAVLQEMPTAAEATLKSVSGSTTA